MDTVDVLYDVIIRVSFSRGTFNLQDNNAVSIDTPVSIYTPVKK